MFNTSIVQRAEQDKREEWEVRRRKLLKRVSAALHSYFQSHTVRAVYLVGSLTQPGSYRPYSDIDVAVEGLPREAYLTTLAELQDLFSRHSVDLIEMERCRFRPALEKEGNRIL